MHMIMFDCLYDINLNEVILKYRDKVSRTLQASNSQAIKGYDVTHKSARTLDSS